MPQSTTSTKISRYAEIANLVWKYRNAGLFKAGASFSSAVQSSNVEDQDTSGQPEELVQDLEAMGPVFVKIGQSLSTRPDLISPEYLQALSMMQDHCAPIDFSQVKDAIEADLQVKLSMAFANFDEKPLAAASLGQVHRANLRDGTQVVVKVQRPEAESRVQEDLTILAQIAEKIEHHSETGRHFGFSQWVVELRRSLTRELDYLTEAGNLEKLSGVVESYQELVVPLPIWDFTSHRVLTMNYIAGTKLPDLSGVHFTEHDGSELAIPLIKAYLDQIFIHGFVHVDPHPGNVLFTNDERLAIIDLGMVTHLGPKLRQKMLMLILAIVNEDGDEAARRAIEMGEPLSDFDRLNANRTISHLVSEYSVSKGGTSEGLLMLQMTNLSAESGLRPPPEVILLGKTLLNLEHLTNTLAPDLNFTEVINQHLVKVIRHRAFDRLKPSASIPNILETTEMLQEMPGQVSSILTMLAENRLSVKVDTIDEDLFAANLQKIANRVTVGLIVAALIIAAAMLMSIETKTTLWGYPAFAMVFFLIAGLLGIGLVISVLWNDRKKK